MEEGNKFQCNINLAENTKESASGMATKTDQGVKSFNEMKKYSTADIRAMPTTMFDLFKDSLKDEWFNNAKEGKLEGMKEIYEIIKKKGMEEDIKKWRDSNDLTVLMKATSHGKNEVVEWLLEIVQVDVNEQGSTGFYAGWSALHLAAFCDQISCAHILLRYQAAYFVSRSNYTPFYLAEENGHIEIKYLLESHFNLNCPNVQRHLQYYKKILPNDSL